MWKTQVEEGCPRHGNDQSGVGQTDCFEKSKIGENGVERGYHNYKIKVEKVDRNDRNSKFNGILSTIEVHT